MNGSFISWDGEDKLERSGEEWAGVERSGAEGTGEDWKGVEWKGGMKMGAVKMGSSGGKLLENLYLFMGKDYDEWGERWK